MLEKNLALGPDITSTGPGSLLLSNGQRAVKGLSEQDLEEVDQSIYLIVTFCLSEFHTSTGIVGATSFVF